MEKEVFVRGRVPESVRARFKAACALKNKTMDSVMESLILEWLKENENDPRPTK
ncbi:plasmid partition protein ParG [Brasilonema bromeliae]|uniref:ParG n=1 Tax=Brasilonema bromeliae SPC951 TaxID=385972 RepID=A0ABX1P8G6_9CYAN|nr:plasmid partition protein ParG [Brasilonema bromeliae]NMG20714.1 ParG [Brasilonema bromeliae SPC951]